MQKSSGFDFTKILDQTLYTYIPDKFKKLEETNQNVNAGIPENGHNQKFGLVGRLRPVVEMIALSEIIVGSIMIISLVVLACDYDKMYATEDSRLISLMSFGGLALLVVNGMLLLTSLKMEKRKFLGLTFDFEYLCETEPAQCLVGVFLMNCLASYLLISTLLWIYIFVLSIMKIHFALMVIESDANKAVLPEKRHILLSSACVMGVVTLLGSVVHFIGNVCVFTYYNFKYVQPILLNVGP